MTDASDDRGPVADSQSALSDAESAHELRQRAEQALPLRIADLRDLDDTDIMTLMHELQVHQIELEMQNEELQRAQIKLQIAAERFGSLYDFAPVGYLTLSGEGAILEANVTLARQLGVERARLLSSQLAHFVHPDDQSEFFLFRRRLQATQESANCEVRLRAGDDHEFWAHMEGRRWPGSPDDRVWRVAVTDVTERRSATELLQQLNEELERRVGERTRRLHDANEQLVGEIARRREVEALLRDREEQLERRVEERTRSLQSLLEVSSSVVSARQLPQVIGLILDHLKRAIGYTGCVVLIVERNELRLLDYRGPASRRVGHTIRLPLASAVGVSDVLANRKPVIVEDLESDDPVARTWRASALPEQRQLLGDSRSWLAAPLVAKDRAIGVLLLDHERAGYFTEQHADVATTVANQMAAAVENARLYQQVQQLAAMEERQRLARELHDSVSQTFYSIALWTSVLKRSRDAGDGKFDSIVERITGLCDAGLTELRAVVLALRAEGLEKEGLVGALLHQVAAFSARQDVDITSDLCEEPDVSLEVKETLFRIGQEALRNVLRHASARHASVRLAEQDGRLELEVADDGHGFDASAPHNGVGLRSMRERLARLNGTLEIISQPGSGARIIARLPAQEA